MHPANEAWWRQVREIYPHVFSRRRVLEVGSRDVNGSVRQFFDGGEYVGVDWRPGPCVDLVLLAHEMAFARDVSTEVVFLSEGLIEERGKPEQVFSNPSSDRCRRFLKSVL